MIPMNRRQLEAFAAASRNRLELQNAITKTLLIGGTDYSPFVDESGAPLVPYVDEEPAWMLEVDLSVRVPEALEGEECLLTYTVEGKEAEEDIAAFRGFVRRVSVSGSSSTIIAATSGYDTRRGVKREYEYVNAPVRNVLFDLVSDLSYTNYDIRTPPDLPPVTWQGEDRVLPPEKRNSILDSLEEETGIRFVDTQLNTATCYATTALDATGEVVWEVEEGVDMEEPVGVETIEGERYHSVVPWGVDALTGEKKPVLKPFKIDNGGRNVPEGDTYDIEVGEASEDTEPIARRCFREAIRLSRNDVKLTVPLVYEPWFLSPGDAMLVRTKELLPDGDFVRTYRMRCDAIGKDWTVSGEAMQIDKEFRESGEARDERFGETDFSPVMSGMWGYDFADATYFDDSLPWVTHIEETEELELDTEIAAEYGVSITDVEGELYMIEVSDEA